MYPNIIITGTPGVGKTWISMRLAKLFGLKYVSINKIILSAGLYVSYDESRGSFVVDIDKVQRYLVKNLDWDGLVLEGHITHLVVSPDYIDKCLVLRLNPYILYDRLLEKGYSVDKALENVQAEILDIIYAEALDRLGSEKVLGVDVSNGYGKVYGIVASLLGKASLPEGDQVNWLDLVAEKGDLSRFFP